MIELNGLTKSFGTQTAVDHISFQVEPGEVLGFLGPNGAGKSTTMKMLTGFLTPDAGTINVCGYDMANDALAAKGCIGYLPEGAPSYGDMTVLGFLRFIGEVRGYKGRALRERVDKVVADVELGSVLNKAIDNLSKGFKRRVGLAQAMMHDPKVLVLDEPTDGLDPNQKHQVRRLIKNLAADRLVIISTHILEEVEAVCSRVLIISQGRLVADGTPQSLLQQSRYHGAVSVRFSADYDAQPALAALPAVDAVEVNEANGEITVFAKPGEAVLPAVNALAHEHNWQVEELHVEKGRLDEVFRKLTAEEMH